MYRGGDAEDLRAAEERFGDKCGEVTLGSSFSEVGKSCSICGWGSGGAAGTIFRFLEAVFMEAVVKRGSQPGSL
jgi:hypothetical protein